MSELRLKDLDRPVREFIVPVETHLQIHWTVGQALENLRSRQITSQITYFYVVDDEHRLKGVLPARKLLLNPPEAPLADLLIGRFVSLSQEMTLAEAMEEFALHRLLALPVLDGEGKLLGIVDVQLYAEEAVDLAEANRRADLFQMIGFSAVQLSRGRTWPSFKARLPWLLGNIFSGLICAVIAFLFHEALDRVLLLAMFIPMVLTLSESISMQSMTLTLQYLHGSNVPLKRLRMRLASEWKTSLLLSASCALLVALAVMFWPDGIRASGAILLSIFSTMLVAATLGAVVPFSLHLRRHDATVASGPMVLMITDIFTTAFYLGLATILLL